jgi:hypothetical protein
MIDIITLGTLFVLAPWFNSGFWVSALFSDEKPSTTSRTLPMTLVSQSTTIAKDALPAAKPQWMPEDQDVLSHYMGQVIDGWANVSPLAVQRLLDGWEGSLDIFYNTMSDGKLAEGSRMIRCR